MARVTTTDLYGALTAIEMAETRMEACEDEGLRKEIEGASRAALWIRKEIKRRESKADFRRALKKAKEILSHV